MKCIICNHVEFETIHAGTRDSQNIKVMRCKKCGMVQLDSISGNSDEMYSKGEMLQNTYNEIEDSVQDLNWNNWINITERDDERRYLALKELCTGKNVIDFGCGNGGFLRKIKQVASSVIGIELMQESQYRLGSEGITVLSDLGGVKQKDIDIICMFDVIEHLNNPDDILKQIYDKLPDSGIFICETPNSKDALISKYCCKAFQDFTYWSKHVFLFDSENLKKILERNGFKTIQNCQIQRYSLANHLYWLSNGKPGGHEKWTEFNEPHINEQYSEILADMGIADTLFWIGRK